MLREAEVVRARKGVRGGMRGARAKRCAGSVSLAKPGRLHPGHRQRVRRGVEIKLPEGSRGEHGMHVVPLPIIPKLCLWAPCLVFSFFMGALCSCEERCAAGCLHWRCPRWEAPVPAAARGLCRSCRYCSGGAAVGPPLPPSSQCPPWLPGRVPVLLF